MPNDLTTVNSLIISSCYSSNDIHISSCYRSIDKHSPPIFYVLTGVVCCIPEFMNMNIEHGGTATSVPMHIDSLMSNSSNEKVSCT